MMAEAIQFMNEKENEGYVTSYEIPDKPHCYYMIVSWEKSTATKITESGKDIKIKIFGE